MLCVLLSSSPQYPETIFGHRIFIPGGRYWLGLNDGVLTVYDETIIVPKKSGSIFPGSVIELPLWLPFVVVAIPTVFLFWRDRRRLYPPGHCQTCGYNLTGNVSGVCPECGEPCKRQSESTVK
jgi:hypothetical protein